MPKLLPKKDFVGAVIEKVPGDDHYHQYLDAVRGTPLTRFVQVSSLGVYAARHHYGTDESEPLPASHIDGYTQSKVECEALALEEYRKHGTPVTVVRPGFIYGPRDRTVLRAKRDILRRSTIGAVFTNRNESAVTAGGSNQAYGVDAAFGCRRPQSLLAVNKQTADVIAR